MTTGAGIEIPEVVGIRGLRFRHYTGPEDLPAMMAIARAARTAVGLPEFSTLDGMVNQYAHLTNCDPLRDVLVAEVEGAPVAYGRTWWADRNGGVRAFEAICHVKPDLLGRGIGGALLAAQDRHRLAQARSMAAELGGRPAVLTAYIDGPRPGGLAVMAAAGYRLARRHAHMERATFDAIPDQPLPDGIELLPVVPGDVAALRRAFEVDAEVFRDHWGDVDDSETAWQSWLGDPDIQPGPHTALGRRGIAPAEFPRAPSWRTLVCHRA